MSHYKATFSFHRTEFLVLIIQGSQDWIGKYEVKILGASNFTVKFSTVKVESL